MLFMLILLLIISELTISEPVFELVGSKCPGLPICINYSWKNKHVDLFKLLTLFQDCLVCIFQFSGDVDHRLCLKGEDGTHKCCFQIKIFIQFKIK